MTIQSRATLQTYKSARRINPTPITYSTDDAEGELTAVAGDTEVDLTLEDGTTVRKRYRDYLILREELEAIIGSGNEPLRGHQIIETIADYRRTYEVIEIGDEIYRWWGHAGSVYRIHTLEVSKETTTGTTDGD